MYSQNNTRSVNEYFANTFTQMAKKGGWQRIFIKSEGSLFFLSQFLSLFHLFLSYFYASSYLVSYLVSIKNPQKFDNLMF